MWENIENEHAIALIDSVVVWKLEDFLLFWILSMFIGCRPLIARSFKLYLPILIKFRVLLFYKALGSFMCTYDMLWIN